MEKTQKMINFKQLKMKKFKIFDQVREMDVSQEHQPLINSLDIIINNIINLKTFEDLLLDLSYDNFSVKNIDYNEQENLKEYLEKNFISISKLSIHSMVPPLFNWYVRFDNIKFTFSKNEADFLLSKNFQYYKNIINNYGEYYVMKHTLYYDLHDNKFKKEY